MIPWARRASTSTPLSRENSECEWTSMNPGLTTEPLTSTVRCASEPSSDPTEAIRSPLSPTSAAKTGDTRSHRPPFPPSATNRACPPPCHIYHERGWYRAVTGFMQGSASGRGHALRRRIVEGGPVIP